MKIATWNVNGIRARQAQVQEYIEREQPDVLCLQDQAAMDQLPLWSAIRNAVIGTAEGIVRC
jgi:exonuclease III